jgi:hypothetical protein
VTCGGGWHYPTGVSVQLIGSIFKGQGNFFTLEDESKKLSRNVGKELPPFAALTSQNNANLIDVAASSLKPRVTNTL